MDFPLVCGNLSRMSLIPYELFFEGSLATAGGEFRLCRDLAPAEEWLMSDRSHLFAPSAAIRSTEYADITPVSACFSSLAGLNPFSPKI